MRPAARLVPSLAQAIRHSPVPLRPAFLPLSTSHAGPSTLSQPRRYLATPVSPPSSQLAADAPTAPTSLQVVAEEDAESGLPSNLTFEDEQGALQDEAEAQSLVGEILHSSNGLTEPILLPVSSLASPTPTLASPEDLAVLLPPAVFAAPVRRDVLHRCVVWYLANLRKGLQRTKSRSELAYSGRKLRPQKGTGRARIGDASAPHLRGGAKAHPIRPRDWSQELPRKFRALGMRIALSTKLNMGLLRVVQDLDEAKWAGTGEAVRGLSDGWVLNEPTNSPPARVLEAGTPASETAQVVRPPAQEEAEEEGLTESLTARFGPAKRLSILFVHLPNKTGQAWQDLWSFQRVTRNIQGVEVMSADDLEVYHLLKSRWVVLEGDVVDWLVEKYAPEGLSLQEGLEMDDAEGEWEGMMGEGEADVQQEVTAAP